MQHSRAAVVRIGRRKVIFITQFGSDGLPELQTYDCKECGVAMTEAVGSQLTSTTASDRAPIIGALLSHGLLVSSPDPQPDPTKDQRGAASSRRRF